jgi:hypothetical protein
MGQPSSLGWSGAGRRNVPNARDRRHSSQSGRPTRRREKRGVEPNQLPKPLCVSAQRATLQLVVCAAVCPALPSPRRLRFPAKTGDVMPSRLGYAMRCPRALPPPRRMYRRTSGTRAWRPRNGRWVSTSHETEVRLGIMPD